MEKDLPVSFLPNKDHLLVKRDKVKRVTEGGIHLPDDSGEDERHVGSVVAENTNRFDVPERCNFNIGDKIAYSHSNYDNQVTIDGETYDLVHRDRVLGTYNRLD